MPDNEEAFEADEVPEAEPEAGVSDDEDVSKDRLVKPAKPKGKQRKLT